MRRPLGGGELTTTLVSIAWRLGALGLAAVILDRLVGNSLNTWVASLPRLLVVPLAVLVIAYGLRGRQRRWKAFQDRVAVDRAQLGIGTPQELRAILDEIEELWTSDPDAAERRLLEYKRQHPASGAAT
jgi:hypothetical protein